MRISERLKLEILRRRSTGKRQYRIAQEAALHPTVLSAILNDALPISADDPRVARLASVLGVGLDEALEDDPIVALATGNKPHAA